MPLEKRLRNSPLIFFDSVSFHKILSAFSKRYGHYQEPDSKKNKMQDSVAGGALIALSFGKLISEKRRLSHEMGIQIHLDRFTPFR